MKKNDLKTTTLFASFFKIFKPIFSLTIVFVLMFFTTSVKADDELEITDNLRGSISTNCSTIKNSLKNLQKADSKTRVILGTTYEKLYSSYIKPLNVRLTNNGTPNMALTDLQLSFTSAREAFNQQFITYSRSLENLLNKDCKSDPDSFYRELEKTRKERKKLETAVGKVNAEVKDHLKTVKSLTWNSSNQLENSPNNNQSTPDTAGKTGGSL